MAEPLYARRLGLRHDGPQRRTTHGQGAPRLSNTLNFAIPDLPAESLAIALDLEGIAVSTGSACSSGAVEPSHVIRAMGFSEAAARGAVRVSMGWSTRAGDIDRFLEVLPRVVDQVRHGLADRSWPSNPA